MDHMEKVTRDVIRLKIPSDPKYVSSVRALIGDLALKNGFDRTKNVDLQLAANEALANVIEHAYDGQKNKVIFIYIIVTYRNIEVIIKDLGKKVNLNEIKSRPLTEYRDGGLGVFLINNMVDEVVYTSQGGGTELKLVKNK
jgi:serine/threonine-protein kinase RsbW